MDIDVIVVLVYFGFLLGIGWMFRSAADNTSEYFRGGGRMLWWMVGSTAFMTQFSAWTFTGAAGKAFNDGFAVLAVFVGNMVAYVFAYFYFARRFRQMRGRPPARQWGRRLWGHQSHPPRGRPRLWEVPPRWVMQLLPGRRALAGKLHSPPVNRALP